MFDPANFLPLARKLAGGDEASARTSVGRAYYASFLIAREKLDLSGLRIPEVHQRVIEELHIRNHLIANNLHQLRRMRNNSDYNLHTCINASDARRALMLAERILEWFSEK